jgi:hypothetical protein
MAEGRNSTTTQVEMTKTLGGSLKKIDILKSKDQL